MPALGEVNKERLQNMHWFLAWESKISGRGGVGWRVRVRGALE